MNFDANYLKEMLEQLGFTIVKECMSKQMDGSVELFWKVRND